jgi:hypothetical protein
MVEGSKDGKREVAAILSRTDLARDRAVFDVFLKLLDDPQDESGIADSEFWYMAHELPEAHPEWGCELAGHYLANRLVVGKVRGIRNPLKADNGLVPHHIYPEDFMSKCAERSPWPLSSRSGLSARDDRDRQQTSHG